jgi:5-(carboxyamino)imidazole ribonucleotide mutase
MSSNSTSSQNQPQTQPFVGIIMGSISDWDTMENTATTLENFNITYEKRVISAHRAPKLLSEYAQSATKRGLKMIIAGAGGAAHLAGVTAALTEIPVLGVPIQSKALNGLDSLLSIVQMPAGIPVPTFAIGKAGAINAALCAISILGLNDKKIRDQLNVFRQEQTNNIANTQFPE